MRSFFTLLALLAAACEERPGERVLHPFPERYAGVGLELRIESGLPRVVRILPGSAAERAGVRAGDVLLEVDGVSTRGWALADVVAALRGKSQSRVILTIRRVAGAREIVPLRRGLLVRPADAGLDGRLYRAAP